MSSLKESKLLEHYVMLCDVKNKNEQEMLL